MYAVNNRRAAHTYPYNPADHPINTIMVKSEDGITLAEFEIIDAKTLSCIWMDSAQLNNQHILHSVALHHHLS